MAENTPQKKATPLTEEQLSKKEAALKTQGEKLAQGFADLKAKEKEFAEKVAQPSGTPKEEKKAEPLKVTYEDEDYQFHPDAPELILFDGKGWTHKQIAENKDVLLQIIGGGLDLIIKI